MTNPYQTLIWKPVEAVAESLADYHLGLEIGRGGMSVVYEAKDRRDGEAYALKLLVMPPGLTAEDEQILVARFEREARTIARLSHPNIVDIHEVGEQGGRHFLAMEYLLGQTLRERMNRETLTPEQTFPLLTQIASALDAVHAAGIIHRDIKPTNVMLLPDGTAKLLDFGIARSCEETTLTSAGVIIGSPSYMAPEQVRGEPGTTATDLWALGVLAYEMLAGHSPFTGQTVASVLYQITNESPARTPGLPVALQKVLRRALDKRPSRRFPDAATLVQALVSAQAGQAVSWEAADRKPRPFPVSGWMTPFPVSGWMTGVALGLIFLLSFCWSVLQRQPVSAFVSHSATLPRPVYQPWQAPAISSVVHLPMLSPQRTPRLTKIARREAPVERHFRSLRRAVRRLPQVVITPPRRQATALPQHRAAPAAPPRFPQAELVTDVQQRLTAPQTDDDPEAEARLRKTSWAQHE